ncbi:DNA-processing protein DprA [Enterococcus faecalis]
MEAAQRQLLFKLTLCKGIGNRSKLNILAQSQAQQRTDFSETELLTYGEVTRYKELFLNSWRYYSQQTEHLEAKLHQHQFLTILDPIYPKQLKAIYNPPALLFYAGNLQLLTRRKLAVVGARYATSYGLRVTRKLVAQIVEEGFTVVSGLAKGVDSCSHQTALAKLGSTIAVIGTGLDVSYPPENAALQTIMKQEQLVLSEYPNGSSPKSYHFPARNRIIAGLSLGTCIMEARKNSGSLITAQAALDYGREVFAVPGSIFHSFTTGCHELIKDGAKCTTSIEDIVKELSIF